MPLTIDELLAALPEVGLWLWMLDQTAAGWHAAVYDPLHPLDRHEADGMPTPADAVAGALRAAGVVIT